MRCLIKLQNNDPLDLKKKSTRDKRKRKDELSKDDGNLSEDNNPLDLEKKSTGINVRKQIKLVINAVLHDIFSLRRDTFLHHNHGAVVRNIHSHHTRYTSS